MGITQIVVIASHPDDELLWCGGSINRWVKHGAEASALILAEGLTSRNENRLDTSREEINSLRDNALSAANIIGYEKISFENFPDNRMDSVDLLDIIHRRERGACMIISDLNTSKNVLIIAEISANHGHDINIAKQTIKAAKEAGADAIKLQTYTADTMTINCDNEYFRIDSGTIWDGKILYDLYKEAYTPWEWHDELFSYAREIGIICFSTPFDKTSVDFLESLNTPAYKIASFEITDLELVEYIASKRKPVIMSVGIASLAEIEDAVNICKEVGNDNIALLQCTSSYPAKIEDANLAAIKALSETFGVDAGLSDHTLGIVAPVVSVALGARIIEKHFILDKNIGGPDAEFSLNTKDFKLMVHSVRMAESAIGCASDAFAKNNKKGKLFSRSLFVIEDVKEGEMFTVENVRSIRPGHGISPKHLSLIIGKTANRDIKRGTPVSFDIFG